MRLLVVMTPYPFPPQAGNAIVAYNNIKELSKKHSIYFICCDVVKEVGNFSDFVEQIEFVRPKKIAKLMHLFHSAVYIFLGISLTITEMQKRVKKLIECNRFDAILLYGIGPIQYCPPADYKKIIVNIEDPQSIKLFRMKDLAINSKWGKIKLSVHARLTEQYEKNILPRIAKVVLLSKEDAKDMSQKGGYSNIECVPYGVSERAEQEIIRYESRTKGTIVFSGSMFHPPNIDGALFFLKHIFPLILKQYPTAVLWIVGARPDKRIYGAAACFKERAVITGTVNEISKYVRQAIVSICPVRLKIGVQTKILEALSWGTPVVTTSAGNSGIQGCSGAELWVEDEAEAFAGRVTALLRGENWNQFSEAGRKFVKGHFSWRQSADELEQHIQNIQK
jgi:polysaccharide biosynthesis protein PslH